MDGDYGRLFSLPYHEAPLVVYRSILKGIVPTEENRNDFLNFVVDTVKEQWEGIVLPDGLLPLLLEHDPEIARMRTTGGGILLHEACKQQNDAQFVEMLLELNPDTICATDGLDGCLPLYWSAGGKGTVSLEIFHLLLHRFPDAVTHRSITGKLPLHHALESNAPAEIVLTLLEIYPDGASVRPLGLFAMLPLAIACKNQLPFEVVNRLVQLCPEALHSLDFKRLLPLHHALCSSSASLEVVRLLIDTYPMSMRAYDDMGRAPIHVACMCRAPLQVVQFLLEKSTLR